METKKNSKANLEKYRGIFLKTGFIISLAVILLSFEWESNSIKDFDRGSFISIIDDDPIPQTFRKEPPKIIPPVIIKVLDKIDIIDDSADDDDLTGLITSDDQNLPIYNIDPIIDDPVVDTFNPWELEISPKFIGGDEALNQFMSENLKYPRDAFNEDVQGKVFVKFVVDEKGKVTDIHIERGVNNDLDKEAMRVVSIMPDWKPGFVGGKYVKSFFIIPVRFSITK